MIASAAIGAGASVYSASKAAKAQKKAANQATQQATYDRAANERALNRQNQKTPDLAAIFGANRSAQSGGVGSTMLTGPGGVGAGSLTLDKHTLLGQ